MIGLLFNSLLVPGVLQRDVLLHPVFHRVLKLLEVHLQKKSKFGRFCIFDRKGWFQFSHLELFLVLACLLVQLDDGVLLQVLVQLHRSCQTLWESQCENKRKIILRASKESIKNQPCHPDSRWLNTWEESVPKRTLLGEIIVRRNIIRQQNYSPQTFNKEDIKAISKRIHKYKYVVPIQENPEKSHCSFPPEQGCDVCEEHFVAQVSR